MSEVGILERTWENIQRKTFTGWVNSHLRKRNLVVSNIETDFEDGLKLIALLEIISDDIFNYKYDKRPKMRIQKVSNVGHCLSFIKAHGVQLAGVGPEEIVDGNLKMILGMIWTIILRFQIQDISMEDLSAKEGLLLWCQKKTQGYAGVNVKNFHLSFQDGLAFCALIHKHRPDLLNWDALDKNDKQLCLQTAFDVADKYLDIPKLMDPSDLLDVAKPDERSVMTYVSLYYHVFASSQKAEAAGKRVGKVVDFVAANDIIKNDYLQRAKRLVEWIHQAIEQHGDRQFDNTLEGVVAKIGDLKQYRITDKPSKYNEKVELEALNSGLQTKLSLNNRPPFDPPAGLSPKDIDALWANLEKAEHDRHQALVDELRRMKRINYLIKKFNQLAGKLESWAAERQITLDSSDLGDTVSSVNAKLKNLDAFNSEFDAQKDRSAQLRSIGDQLAQLEYNDMNSVHDRVSKNAATFDGLTGSAVHRRAALEKKLHELQQLENLLLDFAKRGLEFRVWLENADDLLSDPILAESVQSIEHLQASFQNFLEEIQAKEQEFQALGQLAQSIQQAGVPETTYSEVSYQSLIDGYNSVNTQIDSRREALAAALQTQQHHESLRVHYAQKATSFSHYIKGKIFEVEALQGDIQTQLQNIQSIQNFLNTSVAQYNDVVAAAQQLEDNHVADNTHTDITIESLKSQWETVHHLVKKKQQVLEKELLAQSGTGLSAEQVAEFKECFKHFDKDEDHMLSRLELGACLKSIGEDVDFEAGGKLDNIISQIDMDGDGRVNFEEFCSYMERVSSGSDTPESIKQAFKTIAGDKDYVTEADLRNVLPNDKVDYILAHIQPYPGVANAYDYKTFTDSVIYGK